METLTPKPKEAHALPTQADCRVRIEIIIRMGFGVYYTISKQRTLFRPLYYIIKYFVLLVVKEYLPMAFFRMVIGRIAQYTNLIPYF